MPRRRTQASAAAAAGGGDASDGDGGFYAPQPAPQSTTDAASRARRRGRGGKSGDAELDDGRSGSDTAAVAGRKAQRKHAAVKCHLCGRGGHLRAECPGLDDGGSGQSKYKGKYSRRPGRSEANEPKEPQPWWPAEAAAVAVDDWGCRLHRLFERERHRGTLGALRKKAAEQWPPRLRRLVCVVDEPGLLLPDAASPWYHFWEDADCTAEDGPAVQLAFGVAPADAAVWGSALRAELVPCLQLPQCIAVGVVGLDFAAATQAADRRVQLEAFLQQLQLAKEHKLIVLCSVTGGAEEPFGLALQRELPAEWPIVLTHYRGNDPDWLYRLMKAKPGLRVAFDGSITFGKAQKTLNMAVDCPPARTLLASWAPDLRPTTIECEHDWSHSGHIIATVAAIANARKEESVEKVLADCDAASEALIQEWQRLRSDETAAAKAPQNEE